MSCSVSEYDRGHDTVILSPGSQSDSCQIHTTQPPSLPPSLTSPHLPFMPLSLSLSVFHTFLFSPIEAFSETFPYLTFFTGISVKLTSVGKT